MTLRSRTGAGWTFELLLAQLPRSHKENNVKEIREMLDDARFHIDGQINCHTPEYHALDKLERALTMLVQKVEMLRKDLND
jgi:hypothetical protein